LAHFKSAVDGAFDSLEIDAMDQNGLDAELLNYFKFTGVTVKLYVISCIVDPDSA
jgi:hypothetical protein